MVVCYCVIVKWLVYLKMLLGFMLSLSNRKCDLLGEPTQNLGLIVIAKDLDKDSFGTAVKRAE